MVWEIPGMWQIHNTYTRTYIHCLLCQLLLWHFSISCFNWNLLFLWDNHSMPQADVNHSPTHLISLGQEVGSQHSSHFPSWSLTITPILLGKSLALLELRIFGSLPNRLISPPQAPGTWIHHSQCFSLFQVLPPSLRLLQYSHYAHPARHTLNPLTFPSVYSYT